jgi:hypothetical protein
MSLWRDRLLELQSLQAILKKHRPLSDNFTTLLKCRTVENEVHLICHSCGTPHYFDFHCNKRFCPCCAFQISMERRKLLEACSGILRQPKHVVLTARNNKSLEAMMHVVLGGVRKLRRRDIFAKVAGGWCGFEVSNESRGWHVHAHMLVDVRWLDARELSKEWAECVGQDFAIVKVKDARERSYLAEVTKYTVKPSVFLKWSQEERAEFVRVIKGKRLFFAFGHVGELAAKTRKTLRVLKAAGREHCCKDEALAMIPRVR